MLKQKSKKHTTAKHNVQYTVIHPSAETLGAIALTIVSFFVSFEAIIEHHGKVSHHDDQDSQVVNQIFARAETKGETARLPEEFDIGLQAPHVSGL